MRASGVNCPIRALVMPEERPAMILLYNSDGFTVLQIDLSHDEATGSVPRPGRSGIEIVDEQNIDAAASEKPTAQLNAIATAAPDVILAVPLGAQCPTFLSTLAEVKAANPGWDPKVFITATCASALILTVAGPAADGLYKIGRAHV